MQSDRARSSHDDSGKKKLFICDVAARNDFIEILQEIEPRREELERVATKR